MYSLIRIRARFTKLENKGNKKQGEPLFGITELLSECGIGPAGLTLVPVWAACLAQGHRRGTAGGTAQQCRVPARGSGSCCFMSARP